MIDATQTSFDNFASTAGHVPVQSAPVVAPTPKPPQPTVWPAKLNLFGVQVTATNYEEATQAICQAARQRESAVVSLHPVHAIIESVRDAELLEKVNRFQIVATDGQPVRWALNLLHRAGLQERVYGPELMLRLCRRAAGLGIKIFLYGSSPQVLSALEARLVEKFPQLQIAGSYSPPFRPLTAEEDAEIVRTINDSGAGLVFLGLGCPKQDHFAAEHQGRIRGVQVCVGAAFDFHAGNKKTAPAWMQQYGLEWLFRLTQEPGRLWKRYLFTNSQFVARLAIAYLRSILHKRTD